MRWPVVAPYVFALLLFAGNAIGDGFSGGTGPTTSATTTSEGVVELATDAETVTGTSDSIVTTPGNITARMAAPGTIGGTTPAGATFTTLAVNANEISPAELDEGAAFTWTSTQDASGATSLLVPTQDVPTLDAEGEIGMDTAITGHTDLLVYRGGDSTEDKLVIAIPRDQLTTTDAHVIAYNATDDEFEMVAGGGGSATQEFFIPVTGVTTASFSQLGDYTVCVANSSGEDCMIMFFVPADFSSITDAVVILATANSSATADIDVAVDFAANGEAHTTNSGSDTSSSYDVTTNQMFEMDISGTLTGLAAGDYVGVFVTYGDSIIQVMGIRFKY